MTSRESDKFMLRLPDGMRDRIKANAEKNNRSMNAEIVSALEAIYPPVDPMWLAIRELSNAYSAAFSDRSVKSEHEEALARAIVQIEKEMVRQGKTPPVPEIEKMRRKSRVVSNSQAAPASEEKSRAGEE